MICTKKQRQTLLCIFSFLLIAQSSLPLQAGYFRPIKDEQPLLSKEVKEQLIVACVILGLSVVATYFQKQALTYQHISQTPKRKLIKFDKVAGNYEAKEELEELIDFLKSPKSYTKNGAKIPKGFLLIGPPGTGKTLLAKAVAGEANCSFFNINGSEFISDAFLGTGAARVRAMFKAARSSGPSIIFIDEIDAIASKRSGFGGVSQQQQTLNQLLTEMDGFTDSKKPIVVIAATNRVDTLDSAILRPGRFDRKIEVPLPTLQARKEILEVHAKKYTLSENCDLVYIARKTAGFSGAELENLLNQAALFAIRDKQETITNEHFERAYDRLLFGKENTSLIRTEEERILTAYHEAGHTLVRLLLPKSLHELHKVTITPRGHSLGAAHFVPQGDIASYSQENLLSEIRVALAGKGAEQIMCNHIGSGPYSDLQTATTIARNLVLSGMTDYGLTVPLKNEFGALECSQSTLEKIDTKVEAILQEQYKETLQILQKNKDKLESLAQALLEKETLTAQEVYKVLGL